jgi:hypothetical protein
LIFLSYCSLYCPSLPQPWWRASRK